MADNEGDKTFTQEELEAKIAEAVGGLKKNRDEAFDELKTIRKALKGYDGIDPEEYVALKEAANEAASKKAKAEGDWEAREKQLADLSTKTMEALKASNVKETDGLRKEVKDALSSIERLLVDARAIRAITEAKGSAKVLLPHVKQFVKVVQKTDGEYDVEVVDSTGTQRVTDGQGTPMTLEEFVAEMREDPEFARNFEGSGSSGGGSTKSSGGVGGKQTVAVGDNKAFMDNLEGIAKGEVEYQEA